MLLFLDPAPAQEASGLSDQGVGRVVEEQPKGDPVIIKKYANRRLYNTQTSSYVTLDHLCEMVKDGTEFEVRDARTGEDITRSVLTQIIFEEEAKGQSLLPIKFLRQLIRFYGDSLAGFRAGLSRHVDGELHQEPGSDAQPHRRSVRRRQPGARSHDAPEPRDVRARDADVLALRRQSRARSATKSPRPTVRPRQKAKPSEDISELKSEIEAMRRQLAELSQRK